MIQYLTRRLGLEKVVVVEFAGFSGKRVSSFQSGELTVK
jgi:hypothetical protein